MTEQHPETTGQPSGLEHFNRLRAAYAGAKAEGARPEDTIPATMIEIACLLHLLDNTAVTSAAVEAMGAEAGWNAAVVHTANALGPTADQYRIAMLRGNPFTEQARFMLEVASTNTERPTL